MRRGSWLTLALLAALLALTGLPGDAHPYADAHANSDNDANTGSFGRLFASSRHLGSKSKGLSRGCG